MDYLRTLSDFAAALRFEDLPQAVRQQTALVRADTLAAVVAGSAENEVRAMVQ